MKSKRIKWLDFAKGIVILLVVLCHTSHFPSNTFLNILGYILLTLIMPLFFAISGFLYKPTNNFKKYKILLYKKASSFIIPYVIFTIICITFRSLLTHIPIEWHHLWAVPYGYLWFLYALFFIFLLVGLMDLLHVNFVFQVSISIILMFGQIYLPWHETLKANINPLAGIGGYMICFYLGYIIKAFNLIPLLKQKIATLSLCGLWIILIIISMLSTKLNCNTDMFTYGDISTKLLSIPTGFSLFVNMPHNIIFNYFDKYGKYTLVIYLIHIPLISLTSHILTKFSSNTWILMLSMTVIIWYISIFTCYLAKKYPLINFVFYPRKYINRLFQ